ncbi:MAG: glutaminase domain-containing protein [Mycobacteriales bacterium]
MSHEQSYPEQVTTGRSGPERAGGLSRRRFIQWSGVAGAGVAASAALPGTAVAAAGQAPQAAGASSSAVPSFSPIRPAAVPLAVRSPYLSTWLDTDNLPGTWPAFWTGRITAMAGLARIDGTSYVFLGNPALPNANPFPTMRQTALVTTPTRSRFTLEHAGVQLVVEFFSPVEPGDLERQGRPLSYVSVTASSIDRASHAVSVYLDISGEWASGNAGTQITWDELSFTESGQSLISLVTTPASPRVLTEANDAAEWGTVVWSTASTSGLTWQIGADTDVRTQATSTGVLRNTVDPEKPRSINDRYPVFAFNVDLGQVQRKSSSPVVVSIGHVREPAVSYLGADLAPLWKQYYPTWQAMVGAFHADLRAASRRADALDRKITDDARRVGGDQYAGLCAVALRQAYAGTELVVGKDGKPWAFLKEISSDGNVSTVDVTYPCMPVFLYLDPDYLGLLLAPLLDYPENGGWPKQFAEHDLGSSYPNATGHNDGNEEDMPVEESANMLIMCAAYAARLSGPDRNAYALAHYPILKQWADYLVANALDPGFQNQTDDFTGFIAHSVNLALKGIIGIGAMGQIAAAAGNSAAQSHYRSVSTSYIGQWVTKAQDDSGDHLKLAYDQPGTWSLKYNGYSDRVLRLGLVPGAVSDVEAAWYLSRANTYGVPLDLRHTYTKADWEMWTAAWLKDHRDIRDLLVESLYEFTTTSASRVPMTDLYDTVTDRQVGFQARPVVGGFFALLTV